MSVDVVIAGMWGTTTLRALLLVRDTKTGGAAVTAVRKGPGGSRVSSGEFEKMFFSLVGDWVEAHPDAPIVLAGMVGSNIGWRDVGYVGCPIAVADIGRAERFTARGRSIRIVKGLACTNVCAEPDVMRGEETEIVGWLAMRPDARSGERLACVPGTHAKWVRLKDGIITDFLTSVTGEMFAGLSAGGVLVPANSAPPDTPDGNFLEGVRAAARDDASLLHQLFSVRARRVTEQDDDAAGAQRLSGLIIGGDVVGALALLGSPEDDIPVTVIGARSVAGRYATALGEFGVESEIIGAEAASAAGLWDIAMGIVESGP